MGVVDIVRNVEFSQRGQVTRLCHFRTMYIRTKNSSLHFLTRYTTYSKLAMAITLWRLFPLLFLGLLVPSFASLSISFENTAIVRTVELGGALVHVTTTYAIKAIEAGSKTYTIALGAEEVQKTSWLEAKIKGQQSTLAVSGHGFDPNKYV